MPVIYFSISLYFGMCNERRGHTVSLISGSPTKTIRQTVSAQIFDGRVP